MLRAIITEIDRLNTIIHIWKVADFTAISTR